MGEGRLLLDTQLARLPERAREKREKRRGGELHWRATFQKNPVTDGASEVPQLV